MLRLTPNFLFQSYRDKGMQNNFNLKIFLLIFFHFVIISVKKGSIPSKNQARHQPMTTIIAYCIDPGAGKNKNARRPHGHRATKKY